MSFNLVAILDSIVALVNVFNPSYMSDNTGCSGLHVVGGISCGDESVGVKPVSPNRDITIPEHVYRETRDGNRRNTASLL